MFITPTYVQRSQRTIILCYEKRYKRPIQAYSFCWIKSRKEWLIRHYFAEWDSFEEAEAWLQPGHIHYQIIRGRYEDLYRPNLIQTEIPFGITPGSTLYFCQFTNKYLEKCKGGLVFPIGEKRSCKECASTCSGCIEMAINYGFVEFDKVKHLIEKPNILLEKFKENYLLYQQNKE